VTISAVIFDLDGVLTSTDRFHIEAWQTTCDKWGIPFCASLRDKLRGVGRKECALLILNEAGITLSEKELKRFTDEKNRLFISLLDSAGEDDVLPGVMKLLTKLKSQYLLAVASSSRNAKAILENTGLLSFFDVVIDGTMITRSKPDPEVFQKAAEAINKPYHECLVVEDSMAGVDAALTLGCPVAGVGSACMASEVTYALIETRELGEIFLKDNQEAR
jgi:beta-phosphoglucomutase